MAKTLIEAGGVLIFNGFRSQTATNKYNGTRTSTSLVVSNDKTFTLLFYDTEPVGLLLVATSEYDSDIIMTLSKAELHRACIPKNKSWI